jgi:tRNA1(Val) A37 N6-methylase TrmN6
MPYDRREPALKPAMSLAHAAEIVKRPDVTHDAFLGDRLTIAQPARGFRAGLDSVLLGAATGRATGDLLDLGAGVGTAALVALAGHPALRGVLVEADAETAALAAGNVTGNGFASRADVLTLDLTASGRARAAAGLRADHFASVIANPPYFEAGTAPSPRRAAARHMPPELLDLWVKTAATHAAPGGEIIFIHIAERLTALLQAFEARFGAITILPLLPREGAPAHRILIRGIKGSRAPLSLLASRAVHTPSGRTFRPEFEAIFRGRDRLHW